MLKKNKPENTNSLIKSGSKLSLLVLMSRILGLIRQITMSAFLGTGALADAFTTAFMLPNLFRRLFAENSITAAFIPTFNSYLEKYNSSENKAAEKKAVTDFLNSIFTIISSATMCIVILGIISAPLIIKFFFKDIADYNSAVVLTKIMFPYLFLISMAAFFQGILNGVKIFTLSGFTPILFNISVIGCTYIFAKPLENPAKAMAYGVLFGGFIQAAFQLPFILKRNFNFKFINPITALKNEGTKKVFKLIGPTIIGTAAYQINDIVSTAFAAASGVGIPTALQYSLRLQELLLGVFAVSIGTVILPDMSRFAQRKSWNEYQELLLQSIKIIALITIPATFFSFYNGEHIITLIYKTKKFDDNSVILTLGIFKFHILGLFTIAVNRIIAPAFYAQGDSKSPMLAGIICFAVNILLVIILRIPMKGDGIALSLTIASFINTIVLFIFLQNNKNINIRPMLIPLIKFIIKIIIFSIIALIPLYFFGEYVFAAFKDFHKVISEGVPLIICFIIFTTIGLILLIITKDKTANLILKKRLK